MVSVLDLMTLWLEVESVEDLADFGFAEANPTDYSVNFHVDPIYRRSRSLIFGLDSNNDSNN